MKKILYALMFVAATSLAGTVNNSRTGNPLIFIGPYIVGNCVQVAAGGNISDAGSPCGGGGGGGNIASINSDSTAAQTFTVGTTGSDFNIVDSGGGAHVLELPDSSATTRGALNSTDWTTFNNKIDGTGNPQSVAYWQTASSITSNIFYIYGGAGDATGAFLGVGVTTPLEKLHIGGNARIDGLLRVNPDAGNQNLLVNGPIRLGSGVSIASVDDAVATNTPLELRATTLQLTAVGPGTIKLSTETPGPTILDVLGVTSDANGGQVTIGNSAAAGIVSSTQRYIDFSQTITDFTPTNSWRLHGDRVIVDPTSDSTSDTAIASYSQTSIPNTNANDFGNMIANVAITQHAGTGTVGQNIARTTSATLTGAGTITTNAADSITCQAVGSSAGTITNNYCNVYNSGNQSASSAVVNDFVSIYRTPRTDGPVTNHRAIYAEDQSGATKASYFIYSEGGQSYHQGNFGFGVSSPGFQIDVSTGGRVVTPSGNGPFLRFESLDTGGNAWDWISAGTGDAAAAGTFFLRDVGDATAPVAVTSGTNYVGIQNLAPPALLSLLNNLYFGTTYDGAGGWSGDRTAIELLSSGVRSSWQSTHGEEGLGVRFGTETAHPLFIRTDDTTAITINSTQQTDFSAAATFENDISVNGRILGAIGTVTNANDITLPAHGGNAFSIGGSAAAVNTIDLTDWTPGTIIVLLCTDNFAFHHNTAGTGASILLAGSTDYTCAPNGTLTLLDDGTNWQELARKAP